MKKRSLLAVVLGVLLTASILGVGLVGFGGQGLLRSFFAPAQLTNPLVFADPANIVNSRLQAENASTFIVHVNISEVTDLFTWQISMNWNASRLQVSRVIAGEFLNRTTSLNKTSSAPAYYGGLGSVINVVNNTAGTLLMAETVLNDTSGVVAGVSGSGRLVSVEFLVTGYGWTWLNFTVTGSFPSTLVSPSQSIVFDVSNGWFDNRIMGDVNGDGWVTISDKGEVSDHWTGLAPYARYADWDCNGVVSITERGIVSDHWGEHYP